MASQLRLPQIPKSWVLGLTVAIYATALLVPKTLPAGPFARILLSQGLMAALPLGLARGFRIPMSELGFQSIHPDFSWMRSIAMALGLGALGTTAMLLMHSTGHPALQTLRPAQMLLVALLLAPLSEELLCRGFLQGAWKSRAGIWISASTFAAMHLVLFLKMDAPGACLTLVFTFGVGWLCAGARMRSGSLIPPILLHLVSNVGGLMVGIAYAVFQGIRTGHIR